MSIIEDIFQKIDGDFKYLTDQFTELLQEIADEGVADSLRETLAGETPHRPVIDVEEDFVHALSICLQLLNLVEERAAIVSGVMRENSPEDDQPPGLWEDVLSQLQKAGLTEEAITKTLPTVHVEPVLTAHPTEAKRPFILHIHRRLFQLLTRRDDENLTASEHYTLDYILKATLEQLWRTGEINPEKPDVESEFETVLYYLHDVFPAVLRKLDSRLYHAWENAGFTSQLNDDYRKLPRLSFGNWVGGDRDGHPLVTSEVTRETLEHLRQTSLDILDHHLMRLEHRLTLSRSIHHIPDQLTEALHTMRDLLGPAVPDDIPENPSEPWEAYIQMMRARVEQSRVNAPAGYYREHQVFDDLNLLRETLHEAKSSRLIDCFLVPCERVVQSFGLHTVALDIRQNSAYYARALQQVLEAAQIGETNYLDWDEEKRLAFLNKELKTSRPFLPQHAEVAPEGEECLNTLEVLSDHFEKFGREGLGALIISMTQNLSDLLVVILLAREVGLARNEGDGLICLLPVVPLFETLDDLQRAPGILEQYLSHPVTQRSLRSAAPDRPLQQVMVGYSDSNKDAGILASRWAIHQAQQQLSDVAYKHDVSLQYFHGRGGTPSRGAGPTHRFLEALPAGTLTGDFRVTEQGETIGQKYGNRETAVKNLELLMAGVSAQTCLSTLEPAESNAHHTTLDHLAEYSRDAYQSLLEKPEFLAFWSEATPIDVLERTHIGSRPARRTGRRSLEDLRAIPWVFSWNQARFYLPAWFGVGSGLAKLEQAHPEEYRNLQDDLPEFAFLRNMLYDVETSLASVSLELMTEYASLVQDAAIRELILGIITEEYHLTEKMIAQLFRVDRSKRRRRMLKTIDLRRPALERLHRLQIFHLKEWRDAFDSGDTDRADQLLQKLLLLVNAIASGLRTTG
jgi:phosphoenolpyruvate carboxylase